MTTSSSEPMYGGLSYRPKSGWLELLRIPNLFTVPGDVIAGAAIASIAGRDFMLIVPGILISMCLYGAGLFLNDYCDRKKDARERPGRPIPSGRVAPKEVLAAALIVLNAAMLIGLPVSGKAQFFFSPAVPRFLVLKVILALIILIVSYNMFARIVPWLGFGVMGMCRGANLLLGAALCTQEFTPLIWTAAGAEALYIAAVTAAAYRETAAVPAPVARWLPLGAAVALPSVLFSVARPPAVAWVLLFLFLAMVARVTIIKAHGPGVIGNLIRLLIILQAAIASAVAPETEYGRAWYWLVFIILAALYYGAVQTGKKNYAS